MVASPCPIEICWQLVYGKSAVSQMQVWKWYRESEKGRPRSFTVFLHFFRLFLDCWEVVLCWDNTRPLSVMDLLWSRQTFFFWQMKCSHSIMGCATCWSEAKYLPASWEVQKGENHWMRHWGYNLRRFVQNFPTVPQKPLCWFLNHSGLLLSNINTVSLLSCPAEGVEIVQEIKGSVCLSQIPFTISMLASLT